MSGVSAWVTTGPATVQVTDDALLPGAVGLSGPKTTASWALDAVATPSGTLTSWIQSENGRILSRLAGSSLTTDLSIGGGVRTYGVGVSPTLAVGGSKQVAIGYEVTKAGQGVNLYGQVFCLP